MSQEEICLASACEQRRRLLAREVSAVELLEAHLARIERINPTVNAVVTLDAKGARARARAADRSLAAGKRPGLLHGLPLGVKDLLLTRELRTTFGSPIHAEHVPDRDHLVVERERAAGAVIVGKTNTPEFGAGAQTFNPVFGTTLNPWDTRLTCGGSSGGSAVALACGLVALADGTDFGGSLRAPAAWCNVVGMRPSPGRVPSWPTRLAWSTLSTAGPMGRTVEDVALLLAAQAGPDPRSPIAIEEPGERLLAPLARDFRDVRVAWSPDLGFLPVAPDVQAVCEAALPVLEYLGCRVEHACPDLRGASEVFKVLRAAKFAIDRREEIARHRERIRPTIIANAEEGFALAGLATSEAEERRTVLWHRVREFMEVHEFLVWPVNPVSPFPADQETVTRIGEVAIGSYIDWGALRHIVSVLGLPAISVPAGFTPGGLPVGLQVIGRHHRDLEVLQLAFAFQEATGYWRRRPPAAG